MPTLCIIIVFAALLLIACGEQQPASFTWHTEITDAATSQAVAASIFVDEQLRSQGASVADLPISANGQEHLQLISKFHIIC
jgi:hypothetical protein